MGNNFCQTKLSIWYRTRTGRVWNSFLGEVNDIHFWTVSIFVFVFSLLFGGGCLCNWYKKQNSFIFHILGSNSVYHPHLYPLMYKSQDFFSSIKSWIHVLPIVLAILIMTKMYLLFYTPEESLLFPYWLIG